MRKKEMMSWHTHTQQPVEGNKKNRWGMNLSEIAPRVSRSGEYLAHLRNPIMHWDKIQTNSQNVIISDIFVSYVSPDLEFDTLGM